MVLVIVLLGIIGATLFVSFTPGIRAFVGVDLRKEALQNARIAIFRMIKDIREAQTFSACSPCSPTNAVTFTNILNTNTTFSWSGVAQDPLTRNGDFLVEGVDDYTVTYYASDGTEPADETEIWRIRVDLKVRVGDQTVDLRSEVHPRNLG